MTTALTPAHNSELSCSYQGFRKRTMWSFMVYLIHFGTQKAGCSKGEDGDVVEHECYPVHEAGVESTMYRKAIDLALKPTSGEMLWGTPSQALPGYDQNEQIQRFIEGEIGGRENGPKHRTMLTIAQWSYIMAGWPKQCEPRCEEQWQQQNNVANDKHELSRNHEQWDTRAQPMCQTDEQWTKRESSRAAVRG
ncbi:hypothetical protein K438DRAFT_1778580 [Mycena galopus ATCC 62051]|nr:hypothetical protein K438DRAFT_1778580 [Mycena galopus ATCC 62051]